MEAYPFLQVLAIPVETYCYLSHDVHDSTVFFQVELRVGEYAPIRPVAEKAWLKETGPLSQGGNPSTSGDPKYEQRSSEYGGCDTPGHLEGCHVFYIKVRKLVWQSRPSYSSVRGGSANYSVCWAPAEEDMS